MFNSSKNTDISIVELAVKLNLSVRRIHEIAKESGNELKTDAKVLDIKLAKLIEKQLDPEVQEAMKEEMKPVVKKTAKTSVKPKKEVAPKIVAEPKKKEEKIIEPPKKPKEVYKKIELNPKLEVIVLPIKSEAERHDPKAKNKMKHLQPKVKVDTSVADELLGLQDDEGPKETTEIYDEIISQEIEREIVHSQRKRMAGKDSGKGQSRRYSDEQKSRTFDPNRIIELPEVISVKEFAEKSGISAAKIIGELMKNGVLANINQQIDYDTASIIASDLHIKIKKKRAESSAQDLFTGNLEALLKQDESADLTPRAPIVVVMGHVDHGKTSLLDAIRKTEVAAGESGGITQHIGAYQVIHNGKKVTFLDTPGHEAFTAMRARGAHVTDIAILVVAADEGIKPQTVEAIQHAKDAGVPIIVAINKMDKPGADVERVKGELAAHELTPEDWGGTTIMVPVSAKTQLGISTLLEMVLLVADMANLRANPLREAVATVIEAHMDQSLGPVATVIINTGTLKLMDSVVIGSTYGRVKVMRDAYGKNMKDVGPSTPVFIAGLASTPVSGDILHVVQDEKMARVQAEAVKGLKEEQALAAGGMGEILSQISTGTLKQLKLVLKADALGTLEALKYSLSQIKHEDVGVKIVLSGVGEVNESDVMMAAASQGVVMAFKVGANPDVLNAADRVKVEILKYEVIYKLLDDVKKILTGLLEPEMVEVILGKARVQQVFLTQKSEMIIGCKITDGVVINKTRVRVFRNNEQVGLGNIISLKKGTENTNEIKSGNDCGIRFGGNVALEEGDILEVYRTEKRTRTL